MGTTEMDGWRFLERHVPLAFWYRYVKKRQRLALTLELGPMADAEKRTALVAKASERGFKAGSGAKFTRLVSASIPLRKDEDGEPDQSVEYISELAEKLWRKLWPKAEPILLVLDDA
jgi:hypothetical protein